MIKRLILAVTVLLLIVACEGITTESSQNESVPWGLPKEIRIPIKSKEDALNHHIRRFNENILPHVLNANLIADRLESLHPLESYEDMYEFCRSWRTWQEKLRLSLSASKTTFVTSASNSNNEPLDATDIYGVNTIEWQAGIEAKLANLQQASEDMLLYIHATQNDIGPNCL